MLDRLASALVAFSTEISPGAPRSRDNVGFHDHWDAEIAEGAPVHNWDDRPFSGECSPWSVEPDVRREGVGVRGTVTFHSAHEGAPGRCHGGIVAGLFDDVLGSVLSVLGEGAFTGELTIRYDAPVPLHRELVMRCWLERRDGRKLYINGELTDGDQLVSSARSVFIQPRQAMSQSTFEPQ